MDRNELILYALEYLKRSFFNWNCTKGCSIIKKKITMRFPSNVIHNSLKTKRVQIIF